ncbi:YkgJ family cysteine cluster protein [Candidatus Woesearchaeota archaeon]|nr:YkgJ family cysteine cluster protein [Candidatus Woesearchaeota archaeon]
MDKLISFIRTDIGRFCSQCHSKCCSVGKIIISKKELDCFTKKVFIERSDGLFEVVLKTGCPELKSDCLCNIYPNRPEICREYPIFRHANLILVSSICPYIHEYDEQLEELKKLGARVELI